MSEAELHFIRARLRGGQLSKARRGELEMALPVGLVYDPASRVVLDPDRGVQQAVGHLFATFARTGSARAVVQNFAAEGLLFPLRVRTGTHKGELAWQPLRHWRVIRSLHNPRYAGAFAYGRRREQRQADGRTVMQDVPRNQWIALICDAHPGYITWERYETNQQVLAANAAAHGADRHGGPAREGPALLQGLAVCGRCGRRMTPRYHQRHGVEVPDYQCINVAAQTGGRTCQVVPGSNIDTAVGQLLVDSVTPLALDVALNVQAELDARADQADALRRTHVERARHRADLARRRYLAVDPDNRLVADSLEADWNDALRNLQDTQADYETATAAAAAVFSEEHKQQIQALAADFPALWNNPATPQRERKRMARLLLEDVTLIKDQQIHVHVRFKGGQTVSFTTPIPLPGWKARQTDPDTIAELDRLLNTNTDAATAAALNTAGRLTGENKAFTAIIVAALRRSYQLPSHAQRLQSSGLLTLDEIAEHLHVRPVTIKAWHRAGLLTAHLANDKGEHLYQPPQPGDPRLVKHMGRRLNTRVPTEPTQRGAL